MMSNQNSSDFTCVFRDYHTVRCSNFSNSNASLCERSSDACVWRDRTKSCVHEAGYSPLQQGLLAASLIIGAGIGSVVTGKAVQKYGRRSLVRAVAVVSLVGAVLEAVFWQMQQDDFNRDVHGTVILGISTTSSSFLGLFFVRVLLLGLGVGGATVVSPLYVSEVVEDAEHKSRVGVVFQILVTSGGFMCSLLLLAIKINYDATSISGSSEHDHSQLLARFHIFHIIVALDAGALAVLSFRFLKESPKFLEIQEKFAEAERPESKSTDGEGVDTKRVLNRNACDSAPLDTSQRSVEELHPILPTRMEPTADLATDEDLSRISAYPLPPSPQGAEGDGDDDVSGGSPLERCDEIEEEEKDWSLWRVVAFACVLATILQLSGVNALLNFAPNALMPALGVDEVAGNLGLQGWFFLTTLATLCVSKWCRPQPAFFWSTVCLCVSNLLIGFAVLPSLNLPVPALLGLGITGLALFATAFHCGTGPFFFVLASQGFPVRQTELGLALAQLFQFTFNIGINFGFPLAAVGISGSNGNPNKGLAVLFFIFAGFSAIGAGCFALLSPRPLKKPHN